MMNEKGTPRPQSTILRSEMSHQPHSQSDEKGESSSVEANSESEIKSKNSSSSRPNGERE